MSELWKRNINGTEVLFVNSSRWTRHGFAHDTEVFIDGRNVGSNTAHYLNRTWECFRYQTVMRGAIIRLREEREKELRRNFKYLHDYKKMTPKRELEFKGFYGNDPMIDLYTEVLRALER